MNIHPNACSPGAKPTAAPDQPGEIAGQASSSGRRVVPAVHGRRSIEPGPAYELALSAELKRRYEPAELQDLYRRHAGTDGSVDRLVRRAALRALVQSLGDGLTLAPQASFRHPETFTIGEGVFVGEQAILHGRFDGRCVIGRQRRLELIASLISLPPSLALLVAAAFVGLEAVAASLLLTAPFQVYVALRLVRRQIPFTAAELLDAVRPGIAAALCAVAGWLIGLLLVDHPLLHEIPAAARLNAALRDRLRRIVRRGRAMPAQVPGA